MPEMDSSSKPPQISEMFQKFALAFKTKTFELFAENEDAAAAASADDSDGFSLLDSAEEIITDQKVVVIKPDSSQNLWNPICPFASEPSVSKPLMEVALKKPEQTQKRVELGQQGEVTKSVKQTQMRPVNSQLTHMLVSSIFAAISSFEASYFQLQTAHVPFVEDNVKTADRALVSHLQRLSEYKKFYIECRTNPDFDANFPMRSCLEAQVEENQSKLRTLGTVSDRLQAEIENKDNEVKAIRKKLGEIQKGNLKLSKKLCAHVNSPSDVLLTVRVFDSILHDACRATHDFTKVLVNLMRKAGWDLGLVANTIYPHIEFAKEGHNRYALLSHVCLKMFQGFDMEEFGFVTNVTLCNGHVIDSDKSSRRLGENGSLSNGHATDSDRKGISLKQLLEHVSSNPLELLSRHPSCAFSKFCEKKYQQLIHPTMESSIFSNLDQNELILSSWRSLSEFYESYVAMASSIWTLHKLSFCFEPVVEIFQVEKGVEFSLVYMEDVTRKNFFPRKSTAKVGFTVVPGFKIGKTVIQSQVYIKHL